MGDDINALLLAASEEMNRNLPDMAGDNMVLIKTSGFDMQFTYYLSVLDYSIDEIDADLFVDQMRPRLIKNVCNTDQHIDYIRNGVSIRYIYSDKDRREFTSITVYPDDCNS